MTKHQKHTALTRKKTGIFAPNEIALLGTQCAVISNLVEKVSHQLSEFNLAYFDASHAKDMEPNQLSNFTFHHEGNLSISTTSPVNTYVQQLQFSQFDMVFINGNHYPGQQQIILLDPNKEASITKRIDQLTDIQFFITLDKAIEPFKVVKEKFPEWKSIPVYQIDEVERISSHIKNILVKAIPPLQGLVLTGGKSLRMGSDKSMLRYGDKPQKEVVKSLLETHTQKCFYSVREPQGRNDEIHDAFLNLGPFGGICSAFQQEPNVAWLVMATDLPFVNDALIKKLIEHRNPSKVATAVKGMGKDFPEPLICIYEPKAYPMLLQYLAQGYSCPRKMLINSDVEIVMVDDALIRNINTPEEYEEALKEVQQTQSK